jgi:DNA invertase Pin-like site-specific DNA recombinase
MPRLKVTPEMVEKMREMRRNRYGYKEIAVEFNISVATVGRILTKDLNRATRNV